MLNLSIIVEINAREFPDKTAIVAGDTSLTHRELNEAANRVANGLCAAGIRKGDKVVLSCPTNHFFPICYYGIMKTGAVVVPLNILLKSAEIEYHLANSDAVAYICYEGSEKLPMGPAGWEAFQKVEPCTNCWLIPSSPEGPSLLKGTQTWADLVDGQPVTFDMVETTGDDSCNIIYTSGTTGRPKGAELSHANVFTNSLVSKHHMSYSPDDTMLIALPLDHAFGQTVMMNPGLAGGATVVLLPRFEAGAVWRAIEEYDVTVYGGVPTMYWDLYRYPDADSLDLDRIRKNWRMGLCGGASIPVELLANFQKQFGLWILEGYGLSEVSAVATYNRFGRPQKPGSIGLPIYGAQLRVVDEAMNDVPVGEVGEIVIRGPGVMKGYYKNEEANREAFCGGWFHSGDRGKKDEDGYYYVMDRIKDMILRGGQNIYPREVEEAMMSHPDISYVSVIGIPDERYGESVKAYVVLRGGATQSPEDIIAWARENMAAYAYPRHVAILEALPLGATSKIIKEKLRQMHEEGIA